VAASAFVTSASAVAFQEHVVLPAPHAQQDAPDDGEVVGLPSSRLSATNDTTPTAASVWVEEIRNVTAPKPNLNMNFLR
jgi:hypothetical protein